jgi:hypothetical protein
MWGEHQETRKRDLEALRRSCHETLVRNEGILYNLDDFVSLEIKRKHGESKRRCHRLMTVR